eukprot:scaffold34170_cov36-Prasinocladus_malaysianus.AAC.1
MFCPGINRISEYVSPSLIAAEQSEPDVDAREVPNHHGRRVKQAPRPSPGHEHGRHEQLGGPGQGVEDQGAAEEERAGGAGVHGQQGVLYLGGGATGGPRADEVGAALGGSLLFTERIIGRQPSEYGLWT